MQPAGRVQSLAGQRIGDRTSRESGLPQKAELQSPTGHDHWQHRLRAMPQQHF